MTAKCSVYIATSIDGFIARPDGEIDWLLRPEYTPTGMRGLSYDDFISTVDAIVMGRHSYEKALSFDSWPYENTLVVVLSSRGVTVPTHLSAKVRVESGTPAEIIARLEAEGKKHFYIDGGVTIQRFLAAGLIDEITITQIPILLGAGIPLFSAEGSEHRLRLIDSAASDNGFVQVRYAVQSVAVQSVAV